MIVWLKIMDDTNKGRTKRIHVRVTPDEHAAIERIALHRNLTVSQLIRKFVVSPDCIKQIDIDTSVLLNARRLLKRTASNINQLAWESHRLHNVDELEPKIREALDDISRTTSKIDDFLEEVSKSI